MEFWKIIWKWESWKLNLNIEILEKYLKMEVLKIKFGNGDFGNYLKIGKNENGNFEELFENWIS